MHLADSPCGETLAAENEFAAAVKAEMDTKEKMLGQNILVLEKSWEFTPELTPQGGKAPQQTCVMNEPDAGYQYQVGYKVGDKGLKTWMTDPEQRFGTLKKAKAHLFDVRQIFQGSNTAISWMSVRGWSHRDYHPENILLELSANKKNIKRKVPSSLSSTTFVLASLFQYTPRGRPANPVIHPAIGCTSVTRPSSRLVLLLRKDASPLTPYYTIYYTYYCRFDRHGFR